MRTTATTILMLASVTLAACGRPATPTNETADATVSPEAVVATPAPAPPAAVPAAASVTKEKTDDYGFEYTYPAAAAAIPALAAWLDTDRDAARAGVAKDSAGFRREATADGFPFRAYESTTTWKVVTETPRLLSLSAETYDYTGGAHGSPGFRSVVWDKAAGRRVDPVDMFVSKAAIQAALGDAFCKAVDAGREQRRGAPVVRDDDSFNQCPKVAEATLILGSTDRRAIDRIGLLVGPYVAGSYAEGSYDLTLPVTAAVLRAVEPEYRDAFSAR